jgi:SPP1 family predicted phage head-tail adaptor
LPSDNLKSSRIAAGDLDKRVTLLSPVLSDTQDEVTDWTPAATVWAAIEPVFAQEVNEGARTVETSLVTITIRYRSDIDARWRIADREHTYQVRGLVDVTRRREELLIRCAEIL